MSNSKSSPTNNNNGKKPPSRTRPPEAGNKRKSYGFIETTGFKPNWLETGPLTPEFLAESLGSVESVDETTAPDENGQESRLREEGLGRPKNSIEEEAQHTVEVTEAPSIDAPAQPLSAPLGGQSKKPTEMLEGQPEVWEEELEEQLETWVQTLFEDDHASGSGDSNLTMQMSELIIDQSAAVENDEFIVDATGTTAIEAGRVVEPDATNEMASAVARPSEQRQAVTPIRPKRRDGWTAGLLLLSLLLFGLAAAIYFINPFTRLALNSATVAQPSSASAAALPHTGSGDWCVQGDFLNGAGNPRLADGGSQGDIVSGDGVFALNYVVAQPGAYSWQVVDCENPGQVYPENAAWFNTTDANQPVTFLFDATQRATALFPSVPYIVSAVDATPGYRLVGSFQGWDEGDSTGQLEMISDGLYQQVRRIAAPDTYEAYFLAGDSNQAIDANGRTNDPIPLAFQTGQSGEYVVFMLDSDRGRGSVLYDMSSVLTSLAFGGGNRNISYVLSGLAFLLLLLTMLRLFILRNDGLRMENGCPDCGQQELMRTSRHWQQRLQNMFGIPAYRYRCRNCTWEGTRLSDIGEAISPGTLFAQADQF